MLLFSLAMASWLLSVAVGILLCFMRRLRRVGVYVITVSTSALLASFIISMAVLFAAPALIPHRPSLSGITTFKFAYVGAIFFGGVAGAVAGAFGTRRLLGPRNVA